MLYLHTAAKDLFEVISGIKIAFQKVNWLNKFNFGKLITFVFETCFI